MELAPVHYFPVPQLHLDPALVLLVLLVDRLGEQVRRVLDPWSAQE